MANLSIPAQKVIAFNVVFVAFATVIVILRIVSLQIKKRGWAVHDFLCLFSLVNLWGYGIDFIVGATTNGVGEHQESLIATKQLGVIATVLKVFFVSEVFWSTGVASFRLAILFLYIDIFKKRGFYYIALGTAAVVAAYWVACIFTIFLLCRPINYNWNRMIPDGQCGNTYAVEVFSAAFNMMLDIWVPCLPLPIMWTLQIPMQKKVAISATFALGLTIAGINAARLGRTVTCKDEDFTYCVMVPVMLCVAEMAVGITVACVPVLGPLFFASLSKPVSKQPQYKSGSGATALKGGHSWELHRKSPSGWTELDDPTFQSTSDQEQAETDTPLHRGPVGSYKAQAVSLENATEDEAYGKRNNQINVKKELHVVGTPK